MQSLKYSMIMVTAILLLACSDDSPTAQVPQTSATPATEAAAITLVAMGDSLTAGYGLDESQAYPALLQSRLKGDGYQVRVVNAGISGETSSGARSRVDWLLSRLNPDIVILVTGANDGLRGIDPAILAENLRAIVGRLQENGVQVILGGMKMVRNLGIHYTRAYDSIYPQIAREFDLVLIPFFLEGVAGQAHLNQSDGIHPNAKGYRQVVEHIYPFVKQALDARAARAGHRRAGQFY